MNQNTKDTLLNITNAVKNKVIDKIVIILSSIIVTWVGSIGTLLYDRYTTNNELNQFKYAVDYLVSDIPTKKESKHSEVLLENDKIIIKLK